MKVAAWALGLLVLAGGTKAQTFQSVPSSSSSVARIKDLSGRFGLGFTNFGFGMLPKLSLDWQLNSAMSVEGVFGLDTKRSSRFILGGARVSRNLFIEEYQHFFAYVGGGLLSEIINDSTKSGYYVEGGSGARFFIPSLPNLGLSFRAGLEFKGAGGHRFGTQAFVGAHYYF